MERIDSKTASTRIAGKLCPRKSRQPILAGMTPTNGYIEIRQNRAGQDRAYLAGTRMRVQDVALTAEFEGRSPDEIVSAFPHLSLAQVHAALAYYFDHREAILEELRQDEEYLRASQAASGPGPLAGQQAVQDPRRDPVSP